MNSYGWKQDPRLECCPFCGVPALLEESKAGYHAGCYNYQECAIRPCTPDYATEEEAIAVWNTRGGANDGEN